MIKQKILIVEDDIEVIHALARVFEREGYTVISADNTDEGLDKVGQSKPDLIFLDIKIPSIGGYEFCRVLRENKDYKHIPIIMMTGKYVDLNDKLMGFRLGANDYITKPFETKELIARAKVWLDRIDSSEGIRNIIEWHDIFIDREKHMVKLAGKTVELRPKEFELLYTFVLKANKVLNRTYLLETIMGYESEGYERTVDEHVKNLRKKMGKHAKYIQTVRNYGYKLTDEVE